MLGRNRQGQLLTNFVTEKVDKIKKADINIFQDDFVQDTYDAALLNVTKLWLLSGKWDRIRNPDWAGFFDKRLREYPMNDEGAQQAEKDLRTKIQEKIPDIAVTDVKAIPKLGERGWEVGVDVIDVQTEVSATMTNKRENFISIMDSDEVTDKKVKMAVTNSDGSTSYQFVHEVIRLVSAISGTKYREPYTGT